VAVPLDDVEVKDLWVCLVGGLPGSEPAERRGRDAGAVEAQKRRSEGQLKLHMQDAQAAARSGHALEVLGELVRDGLEARQFFGEREELEFFLFLDVSWGGVGARQK
jgi:hypothetical protein